MRFTETPLEGAWIIDLEKIGDERGFFARVLCQKELGERGLSTNYVQVSQSLAGKRGTLRGMHYQLAPHAETKIVRCIRGALYDAIIDLREDSPTFGRSFGIELTAENRTMLYVPKGFAHGFQTLADDTETLYFIDEYYAPGAGRGVRWNDPRWGIEWPLEPTVMSERDANYPDWDPEVHRT